MSGILKRSALFSGHRNMVFDTGWRKCVTGIGTMLEPAPFKNVADPSPAEYDKEYDDQISNIDEIEWVGFGDWNALCGTTGSSKNSSEGFVHKGFGVFYEQV